MEAHKDPDFLGLHAMQMPPLGHGMEISGILIRPPIDNEPLLVHDVGNMFIEHREDGYQIAVREF